MENIKGTFSFYEKPISNTTPSAIMTVEDVYRYITTSASAKMHTEILRGMVIAEEQRKYKTKYFDSVTFSGVFTKRGAANLLEHSNLLCIDIDHVGERLLEVQQNLILDNMLQPELVFTSPSGDGMKAVVEIDLHRGTHLEWFNAIEAYLRETYDIQIDTSGKDVGRACFLPHDKNCYYKHMIF